MRNNASRADSEKRRRGQEPFVSLHPIRSNQIAQAIEPAWEARLPGADFVGLAVPMGAGSTPPAARVLRRARTKRFLLRALALTALGLAIFAWGRLSTLPKPTPTPAAPRSSDRLIRGSSVSEPVPLGISREGSVYVPAAPFEDSTEPGRQIAQAPKRRPASWR